MSTNTERLDALAYGNRRECLLHIARYFFAADTIGALNQAYNIKTILDAACGLGYGCFILAGNHPDKRVIGLDVSKTAIQHCEALYKRPNVKYICADILKAPKADIVVSLETIEHIINWQEVFSFLMSISKAFIFSVPWKQLANSESKMFHRAFGLYDESFLDLIPEDRVAEWYCQRRYDAAILPLKDTTEQQRAFLIGVVRKS